MDFELSEEQQLLKDMAGRFMQDRYGFETRGKYMKEPLGFDPAIWEAYAEQGLLALPFAEEDGGIGGGGVEVMIVMEQMGKALSLEPYLATAVIGASILRNGATDAQRQALAEEIIGGACKLAFAHSEGPARYDLAHVATRAEQSGDAYSLTGDKTLVLWGGAADKLIVSARVSGGVRDEDGVALFLVDPKAEGVSLQVYDTQDGLKAAEVKLEGAQGELLGETPGKAMAVIRQAADEAIAALCAEAVGAMEKALELTVDYIKQREQFGRAIGSFQGLQFQASDMFVELELAKSMAMYASMCARDPDPVERSRACSAAKAQVGRSLKALGERSIQLHGGVGMTMEYSIGHYFKRLSIIDRMFGDVDFHLQKLDEAGGLAA
ncbi:MAG: acyl-CoA dehydrogenase family protein [Albimonas sp.]|uniref:acyl-CoA dehydrogenase family protein n=1 Tax=Albimonas sp. TaxID=1872425 RepID=UPI004057B0F6